MLDRLPLSSIGTNNIITDTSVKTLNSTKVQIFSICEESPVKLDRGVKTTIRPARLSFGSQHKDFDVEYVDELISILLDEEVQWPRRRDLLECLLFKVQDSSCDVWKIDKQQTSQLSSVLAIQILDDRSVVARLGCEVVNALMSLFGESVEALIVGTLPALVKQCACAASVVAEAATEALESGLRACPTGAVFGALAKLFDRSLHSRVRASIARAFRGALLLLSSRSIRAAPIPDHSVLDESGFSVTMEPVIVKPGNLNSDWLLRLRRALDGLLADPQAQVKQIARESYGALSQLGWLGGTLPGNNKAPSTVRKAASKPGSVTGSLTGSVAGSVAGRLAKCVREGSVRDYAATPRSLAASEFQSPKSLNLNDFLSSLVTEAEGESVRESELALRALKLCLEIPLRQKPDKENLRKLKFMPRQLNQGRTFPSSEIGKEVLGRVLGLAVQRKDVNLIYLLLKHEGRRLAEDYGELIVGVLLECLGSDMYADKSQLCLGLVGVHMTCTRLEEAVLACEWNQARVIEALRDRLPNRLRSSISDSDDIRIARLLTFIALND